jgi:hypothetical protein
LAWLALDALFSGNTKLNQVVQLRVALNLKICAAAFSHKSVNRGIVGLHSIAGGDYGKNHYCTPAAPGCANSGAG